MNRMIFYNEGDKNMISAVDLRAGMTFIQDGKLITNRKINWKETLDLWWEDKEAKLNKSLVRMENEFNIKLKWDKRDSYHRNARACSTGVSACVDRQPVSGRSDRSRHSIHVDRGSCVRVPICCRIRSRLSVRHHG